MSDIKMEFLDEIVEFDVEQYNQLVIDNHRLFLKAMIRLKNLEGEKFDDFYQEKYKGDTYLFGQKVTSKNLFVLDLNDFSKLINNLSFHKSSILRKSFYKDINELINEDNLHLKLMDLKKEYDINDEIDLTLKTLGVEKLFETLMNGSVHKDYIEETNIITSKILEYLDRYEIMRSIIIIDSSIKFFDFKPLVDDERVIIFDTNIQFNQSSNNLVVFGDSVTSYNLNLITDKIEFLWPTEIVRDSLISLLQVYIHMILNDEISNLNYPSDNLICLYIIVRNILGMEISDIRYGSIRFEDDKLKSFIDNNLV